MRLKRQAELAERYFDEFVKHRHRRESTYAVERLAQLAIQSLLGFGAMMAVYAGLPKPETYKGIADLLAERLKLNDATRTFLEQLAGFRNLLVHSYAELDPELEGRSFDEMEERLPATLEAVKGHVGSLDVDPPKPSVRARLEGVFERHGVRFALLFGSRARRGAGRDYDIAASLTLKSALDLGGLQVDVAEALGVNEERVDLLHLDTAPLSMIYTVLSEGTLIYGNPDEAYDFLYRRYLELLDIKPSTSGES